MDLQSIVADNDSTGTEVADGFCYLRNLIVSARGYTENTTVR